MQSYRSVQGDTYQLPLPRKVPRLMWVCLAWSPGYLCPRYVNASASLTQGHLVPKPCAKKQRFHLICSMSISWPVYPHHSSSPSLEIWIIPLPKPHPIPLMPFSQMPLLTEGIRIHGEKLTEQLKPLHDRLSSCFRELKEKVEKRYGVITLVGFVSTAYELFLFLTFF